MQIGVGCSEISSWQEVQRNRLIVFDLISLFEVSCNIQIVKVQS